MREVYVSNGFFGQEKAITSVSRLVAAGFHNVEISSGAVDSDDLVILKKFSASGVKLRLHNYFPCLGAPFVLNLGSMDPAIRERSRNLVMDALRWSSELNSDFYACHAGFRLDLRVDQLGGNARKTKLERAIDVKKTFEEEILELELKGSSLGVQLAVENNVYDSRNQQKFGQDNPFLLCGDPESDLLSKDIPILLDVGHLKVSGNSLGFCPVESFSQMQRRIVGYHLSENNGFVDSNSHINKKSWFLHLLSRNVKHWTLEVYDTDLDALNSDLEVLKGL